MTRRRGLIGGASFFAAVAALGFGQALIDAPLVAEGVAAGKEAPQFEVDPLWPKPLPNHWVLGSAIGVGVGLVLAAALSRVFSRLWFEVHPLDPVVFLSVPAVFLGAAVLAAVVPAVRAARLNPAESLNEE